MPDVRLVALTKAIKGKAFDAAREGLPVGTHPLDFTVRITGSVTVGEDSDTDVRESVDWQAAFATVLGMFQEHIVQNGDTMPDDYMADLVGMIFRQDATATTFAAPVAAVIEREKNRLSQKVTGTKPKRGSVTSKLRCEFVPTTRNISIKSRST